MKRFTNQSNGSYRGHSLMGRAMLRRFALFFPMILLMLLLFLPARMVAQKAASSSKYIATFDSDTETLTFEKYEGESLPSDSESKWVEDGTPVLGMFDISYLQDIKHIVINESFKTFTPTTLNGFFAGLAQLETITGLEYLNTANVTDMSLLFDHCQKLTSLDLSNFNTAKVTNMNRMFSNCSNLKTIYASDKFKTAAVTKSENMFSYCNSLSGDIDWTSDKATDKTYAKTGGGYFRDKAYDNRPYVKYADGTLTFRCGYKKILGENEYELNSGEKLPKWNTHNSKISKVVFEASFANARPTSCYAWFQDFKNLTQIEGIENLNTANVTNMSYMFKGCSNLAVLDVTHFNTAKVTIMSYMFKGCSNLAELDVTHFNTAEVTDMSYMFTGCSNLAELDVTHFNTANVTDMYEMFDSCSNLVELDVTHFNTAEVTDMSYMFTGCSNLAELDVTHFNTANVTDMYEMFDSCSNLVELDVTHFNTAEVTDMSYMFTGCSNLAELDVTHFNTANVTDMYEMFDSCSNLVELDVTHFNTAEVTDMSYMFYDCSNLAELDVTHFNTAKVTIMNGMFTGCSNLTELDLTHFNTANVTNMYVMFSGCKSLTTIYVSDEFVITNITNKSYSLFSDCTKLKGAIDFDASKTNYKFANYKTGYFTKLVGKNGDEKIGATGETLATDNLVLDDGKDFVAYEPFAAKAASYNRTMKEGTTWATLCLPFEVSLADKNFRAFKLLSADDVTETVELEEIEGSIAAGTPVIIKMKDGATKLSISVANKEIAKDVQTAETANGNYQLQGLYTQKMFSKDTDNNCYIVKGDKLMNPAKLLEETATEFVGSKPFRAYMADNSSAPVAGARMFSISVGGSTTAIEQLETTADSKAEYYDLQGRRLQNLQKGVNIVKRGGKTMKVIIK
ncbi:BspA family leucine-rich repeat surface protein [Prevotella copri]|uniref:BspA family leucine-rich repeat surface protein n=2 Tax=Segatella copri TaxID=165179 RepID=UPI001290B06C|nr:BspA family leucine-rich repeat surface protein [Segatella copri]MQM92009.1 BspA family leucine-rich repeat surface protein [Segatella copri]MQN03905.1 BspA family leucine-rich repeat surface protein [Segatella copri]MQN15281.1 BspA family leucine-rich repeat surface protein [Segatella copri]